MDSLRSVWENNYNNKNWSIDTIHNGIKYIDHLVSLFSVLYKTNIVLDNDENIIAFQSQIEEIADKIDEVAKNCGMQLSDKEEWQCFKIFHQFKKDPRGQKSRREFIEEITNY